MFSVVDLSPQNMLTRASGTEVCKIAASANGRKRIPLLRNTEDDDPTFRTHGVLQNGKELSVSSVSRPPMILLGFRCDQAVWPLRVSISETKILARPKNRSAAS